MGKIRARTDGELAARKQEILDAAVNQLMCEGYDAVTLATIAAQTSISRTSMYTYYEKKEDVFVDLMIREYADLEQVIRVAFALPMTRKAFCGKLTDILMEHQVLLKLVSLQLPIRDGMYSDDMMRRFVEATKPYAAALRDALRIQFPMADEAALNRFMVQLTVYANCLYVAGHMPESLSNAMSAMNYFGKIPDGRTICFDGLMLLSAELEKEDEEK